MLSNYVRGDGGRFAGSTGGGRGGRAGKLAAIKKRLSAANRAIEASRKQALKALAVSRAISAIGGLQNSHYLRSGMRDMTHARAPYAGKSAGEANAIARSLPNPVRVHIEPGKGGKTVILNDGRHRMAAAREAGATHIRAHVVEYGARGGRIREWTGVVKI